MRNQNEPETITPVGRGSSPSPSIDRASQVAWDAWHRHGETDVQTALQRKEGTQNPVDPSNPGQK